MYECMVSDTYETLPRSASKMTDGRLCTSTDVIWLLVPDEWAFS